MALPLRLEHRLADFSAILVQKVFRARYARQVLHHGGLLAHVRHLLGHEALTDIVFEQVASLAYVRESAAAMLPLSVL